MAVDGYAQVYLNGVDGWIRQGRPRCFEGVFAVVDGVAAGVADNEEVVGDGPLRRLAALARMYCLSTACGCLDGSRCTRGNKEPVDRARAAVPHGHGEQEEENHVAVGQASFAL